MHLGGGVKTPLGPPACGALMSYASVGGRRYAAKRAERGDPLDVQFLYSGADRARLHCCFAPSLIHFIPDSLKYLVTLFLKRSCDRTLGADRLATPRVVERMVRQTRVGCNHCGLISRGHRESSWRSCTALALHDLLHQLVLK